MGIPEASEPAGLDDGAAAAGICIGVTGHRLDRLEAGDAERPQALIAALFDTIGRAAGSSPIRVVTSLADGIDSMAAQAAIERGWPIDTILPFARDDYAADFAEGEAADLYRQLLANSGNVLELDGTRGGPHGSEQAYERAGRVLLAQCDFLVAVWDGGPVRGRGGAAQIVNEAVQRELPVIRVDPAGHEPPVLLWQGLGDIALRAETIDSVARGTLDALPGLVDALVAAPPAAALPDAGAGAKRGRTWAIAYPLLLAGAGIRRLRKSDLSTRPQPTSAAAIASLCADDHALAGRLTRIVAPRFVRADAMASHCAQLFRHSYVANFLLAALAVLLSLAGLALPAAIKPLLILAEIAIIASILIRTRRGNRAGWHAIWLEQRALAERLRCLAVSARVGDLNLRGPGQGSGGTGQDAWVQWYTRATARAIGLPSVAVDAAYLATLRDRMLQLVEGEIGYLEGEARQMHRLEHRLHRLGTWLFALTAIACLLLLGYKIAAAIFASLGTLSEAMTIAAAIAGAALPALGAAIYGIRMQGDFAGTALRASDLATRLASLRRSIERDSLTFDGLSRLARSITALLTTDVAVWSHSTGARPLTLPG